MNYQLFYAFLHFIFSSWLQLLRSIPRETHGCHLGFSKVIVGHELRCCRKCIAPQHWHGSESSEHYINLSSLVRLETWHWNVCGIMWRIIWTCVGYVSELLKRSLKKRWRCDFLCCLPCTQGTTSTSKQTVCIFGLRRTWKNIKRNQNKKKNSFRTDGLWWSLTCSYVGRSMLRLSCQDCPSSAHSQSSPNQTLWSRQFLRDVVIAHVTLVVTML